jgi:cytochrome c oxidase cbb3-type subunit 3
MLRPTIQFVVAITAMSACLFSQEEMPQRPGGGRGNTREFLGLGTAPDAPAAARGEKLYKPNCGFCHGEKARGAEGPNLVRSAIVLHDEKGDQIGPLVSKGSVERGMPAFPNLTKEQLYDISQFLHLQVELVANRGLYKRLNVVTGDPQKGEAYFNTTCKSCHSVTGDLAKAGSKYPADQLQSRFVWPISRGSVKKQIVVKLASGETVKGMLKQIDDVNVSMFDQAGNYHSWPVNSVKIELDDKLAGHRQLLEKYTDADIHNLTAYLVTFK